MNEIIIPDRLQPFVKAFFAESEDVAKALIIQASRAIYNVDDDEDSFSYSRGKQNITDDELQVVCGLMQSLKPQDMLEALYAAQIIVSHVLGMRKLAKSCYEEQRIGLNMLRFSNEALGHLQKKRSGGMQNITVNYNYAGKVPAPIPTIIPHEEIKDAD